MSTIAIVGMGCRFAGADNLQEYWSLNLEGRNAFGPVPADRWDADAFHSQSRRAPDKSYAPNGGFIQDIYTFPALTLGIPPRRVQVMDPQHRLTIEACLQAVEDSGRAAGDLPARTGVYMGVTATEFREIQSARSMAQLMASGKLGTPPEDPSVLARAVERVALPRAYSAPGALANMAAATVAQELDLHGPAYTVDSACASALIALSDAVNQLRVGQIDAALAGGVYLTITPDHHIAFSRIGAISQKGACRPFDAEADGFVQGDGVGVVMLKRLEDALRDGDRVYAVVHGIGLNSDGSGDGPMAPNVVGQADVIRRAWDDAKLDPSLTGYVETHGTGTPVGDPTEIRGLEDAIGDRVARAWLGSSKANVGHTMSAAGVAGLIRSSLAVYHRVRPPMAGYETPNPKLALEGSPFAIPTEPIPWEDQARVAGVSSFGFGGTNAHVVLSSAELGAQGIRRTSVPGTGPLGAAQPAQHELVLMSAGDEAQLRTLAGETAAAVEADPKATVAGVARAWAKRRRLPARLGVVATSREQLVARLKAVAAGDFPEGVHLGEAPEDPPKVAFLYPGQGAQRTGMLAAIRERFPVVGLTLSELEGALDEVLPTPLTQLIYPQTRPESVSSEQAEAELTQTSNCQPALLACGVALTRLLESLGVKPHVTTGHSLGEFTAAAAAGVLSPADAARFVARRGQAMEALDGDPGTMAALKTDAETARGLLVDGTVLANLNHPQQCVVSGTTEGVAAVVKAAEAVGVEAIPLTVSHGFHSGVLAGLDVAPLVDALELADPTDVTVASAIDGAAYRDAAHARDIFTRHALSPVDFMAALNVCEEAGADLYLQVGSGGPLAAFTRATLKGTGKLALTLAPMVDDDGGEALLLNLARLWTAGVDIDPRAIAGTAELASLPPSRLPRERYWIVEDAGAAGVRAPKLEGSAGEATVEDTRAAAADTAAKAVATDSAGPAGDADEVADRVVAIIAKVSAYPVDAVKPGMTLMGTLGFDSLMVADLATGLTDTFDNVDGIPQELMVNNPTVRDVIEFVRTATPGTASAADDGPVRRWRPTWRPQPLTRRSTGALTEGSTALLVGDEALAKPLAEALAAKGLKPRVATPEAAASAEAADLIVFFGSPENERPIGAILAGEVPWPDRSGGLIAALDRQATLGRQPHLVVLRLQADRWAESLSAVVRVVSREWPDAVAKSIAVEDLTAPDLGDLVAAELDDADRTVDVRVIGGRREIPAFEGFDGEADAELGLGAGDTVAITGGTRGIGAKLAERLAPTGAKLLLIGRGEPSEQAAGLIAASEGRVVHVKADVTDLDGLKAALAPHQPVTGLVHAAGVLADGALGQVDAARGQLARRVKVRGWLGAISACGKALKVALGVGSWAGRFGNRHQAHYAAGNALMSALTCGEVNGIRTTVGEFGPWSESTMVQSIPEAVRNTMRAEGVDFVGDDEGLDALLADLADGVGPLVHARRRPLSRVVGESQTLSVETHPFLKDHAIDGTPVLPLASAADLLASAAGLPEPFELRDLRLFRGVTVKEPVALTIESRRGRAEAHQSTGGKPAQLSYRATVTPVDAAEVEAPARLEGGEQAPITLERFYGDVTFHGPLLQGITRVDGVGEDFVRGRVKTGTPKAWIPGTTRSAWTIDPLALDSAMQMAALVAFARYQRAGTPFGIGRWVQLKPMPVGSEVTAEVRFGDQSEDRFSASIAFWSDDGELLALAEDVVAELREVEADAQAEAAEAFVVKPEWVDPAQWKAAKDMAMRLKMADAIGVGNPYFHVNEGTARDTTRIAGRDLINFSSYNYLGFSGDERVLEATKAAVDAYGTSVSASRVASGERPFHRELERELAACQGVDDSLLFTAGHAANVSTIGHIMGERDLILHDELIHDSILAGIKLSHSARRGFRHEDHDHLRAQLAELRPHYEKVLIIAEGVYSMDGDICDVPSLVAIKREFGCMLMIDEAHSFGIVGRTGQGIREHFDLEGPEVDVWMGTLSKSLASCGGWIGGSQALIDYLRYTVGGFVFSAGMTPANGVAALTSLRLMHQEPWRVEKLQKNSAFFHAECARRGLDTGPARGGSAVVPVITGNSVHALILSKRLAEKGVNVQPIVFPAVADDAARLRYFIASTHSEEQLARAAELTADTLEAIRNENLFKGSKV